MQATSHRTASLATRCGHRRGSTYDDIRAMVDACEEAGFMTIH